MLFPLTCCLFVSDICWRLYCCSNYFFIQTLTECPIMSVQSEPVDRDSGVNSNAGVDQITSTMMAGWSGLQNRQYHPSFLSVWSFLTVGSFLGSMSSNITKVWKLQGPLHGPSNLKAANMTADQCWMKSHWNTWLRIATYLRISCSDSRHYYRFEPQLQSDVNILENGILACTRVERTQCPLYPLLFF